MTSDRSWQAELRKCYQDYVREIEVADSYVPKNQLLCERFHQLETDAIQSIKKQQFHEDSEVQNQPQSNSLKKDKKKKKKNKKKKKKGNNKTNGSLHKMSADVESSSDGEDDENDNDCTSVNLPSAVLALAPSSTGGDSSNSKTSAKPTQLQGTSEGGEFFQDIENIRTTIPGLVTAWKSSEKDRLMRFWVAAPRARREAILRQACPLLVQNIDDQFSIINGSKVYPQSFKQESILKLESRLTIDNLVNELPELLDEVMENFSWYAANLVTIAREIAIPNYSSSMHGNSVIPVGNAMVIVGPCFEQFGIFHVHTPFDSEVLVQHGLVSSIDGFQPVLLVLNELLQLQVGVLNQL